MGKICHEHESQYVNDCTVNGKGVGVGMGYEGGGG